MGAIGNGDIQLVKELFEKANTIQASQYDNIMAFAAEKGHIDIVRFMLKHGATDYMWSLENASYNGHIDIVRLMIEQGAKNFDWAMALAACVGHFSIVQLLIEKGANNYRLALSFINPSPLGHDIKILLETYQAGKNKLM